MKAIRGVMVTGSIVLLAMAVWLVVDFLGLVPIEATVRGGPETGPDVLHLLGHGIFLAVHHRCERDGENLGAITWICIL